MIKIGIIEEINEEIADRNWCDESKEPYEEEKEEQNIIQSREDI